MNHEDSFLPFGPASDAEEFSIEDLPPELRSAGREAYRQGWKQYRKADCPFGPEDRAMIVWFSFNLGSAQRALTMSRN